MTKMTRHLQSFFHKVFEYDLSRYDIGRIASKRSLFLGLSFIFIHFLSRKKALKMPCFCLRFSQFLRVLTELNNEKVK